VLDFRDPWVTNPYRSHFHPFRKQVEALLERFVVRRANIIVANTAELKQEFMERYGDLPKGRFHCIYNSLEVSGRPETCASGACSERPHPITLVHSGFLYGLRDPGNFLQALSQTLLREPEWRDRVRLKLVGTTQLSYSLQALLESLKLDDITKVHGQVSHDSCMEHLSRASVLLLFQPGTGTQIPSKLFEYLPLRKPILAIALPGGATSSFVLNESVGLVADCNDVDDIASKLSVVIQQVASGKTSQSESAYDAVLKRYSVEASTGSLLEAFSKAIAAAPKTRWRAAVRKTDSTP
jgi:glycosyltransferase involved in cell wall biosynthesis